MARNEEKHYGRLNRLYLLKEREEYEKANPKRPRLDTLYTAEEVQHWLPSIKKDLDFYLKKSQVTCYSDTHIEECKEKVVKLEKEFKAFVRKIKQLSPSPVEVIPWSSRPYKRKKPITSSEENLNKEFKRIATPILDSNDTPDASGNHCFFDVNCNNMNQPLSFSTESERGEQIERQKESINLHSDFESSSRLEKSSRNCDQTQNFSSKTKNICEENDVECKTNPVKNCLVNYDSSDCEDS